MTGLVPLLLLWAFSQRRCAPTTPASSPMWPTAASPPPPLPPLPPPPGPSADTGTPLSELAQPTPKVTLPPQDKLTAKTLKRAKSAAKAAAKRKANSILQRVVKMGPPPPAQMDVSVANIQSALVRRGYKTIKKDGLYGPKTELAWKALANGRKLSPMISRLGPKIARVARDTFTALSIP